tara:strand:+ start:1767 stop:3254 length:1488 start_codon:yes stop_codon:yes gene_type:complete
MIQNLNLRTITWAFLHFDPELYIPLTFLSFQFDWFLGGGNPMIFHLTNLVLHIINALLVTWLIYLLQRRNVLVALLAGLLFLVHPLHTEAVAWISARKDVLSAMFFLMSTIGYLYKRKRISLACFVLGLLAKVSIVILPLILLLIDWLQKRPLDRNAIREKIPYFIAACVFGVIAIIGKTQILGNASLITGVLVAIKSTIFYLQKFVMPLQLSVIYPYQDSLTILSPDFFIPVGLLLLLIVAVFLSRKKTRAILFASLFYVCALVPSFTNYARDETVFFASDRYAYLPSIALVYLIVVGISTLKNQRKTLGIALCTMVIITFGFLAHKQVRVWRNTKTLFMHATQYHEYYRAYSKIGAELWNEGNETEALQALNHSIELRPNRRAYYNLGLYYMSKNQTLEALSAYKNAIELDTNHKDAHMNLGLLYWQSGNTEDARTHWERAEQIDPTDRDALINLALLYQKIGQTSTARQMIQRLLEMDSEDIEAHALLRSLE